MFYILSKIFWLVAQPLSVAILLVLLGIMLMAAGKRRWALGASTGGVAVLLLTSFTTLGFVLIQPLEDRFARPAVMPASVDSIIVLGGSTLGRVSAARGVAELNDAGDRLTDAVFLARLYPDARIVYSGGAGLMDGTAEPEAETAARFFMAMGISEDRLLLEGQSRNTDENADFTADLVGESGESVILVTSAFHMPRSVGLFRRVGLDVIAWPTDYRSSGREAFGFDIANPLHNLNTTSIAIKEWIGLVAYYRTGRIAEVLPAQTSN